MACLFGRGEHIYILFQHQTIHIFLSLDLQQCLQPNIKLCWLEMSTVHLTERTEPFLPRTSQDLLRMQFLPPVLWLLPS